MKKYIIYTVLLVGTVSFLSSCKKDFDNLNGPTLESYLKNATPGQLNNLVSGTESGMRNSLALYLDVTGILGREMYHFAPSEPRYVTDLLGYNNATIDGSNFYITNTWAARYAVVKNCNLLIQAATNSSSITDAQRKAYIGFAMTIKAYQLLLTLNQTYANGIRINVADPKNLGPIVAGPGVPLDSIAAMLNAAQTELTGSTVSFTLAGFVGFNDAAGLVKFNRALAARVDVYRSDWSTALADLNLSFFGLGNNFNMGVFNVFGTGSGDQLNGFFIPQNQAGEVRVAHPSYAAEIEGSDDRINKATLRTSPVSLDSLSSDRDVWVYTSSLAPIPIIRNEELILIYAEANIQLGGANLVDAVTAINAIRTGHGLPIYAGLVTQDALKTEMLNQRRYSLFCEGHRWVDMRRYNLLTQLPLDRGSDKVWTQFPLPLTEQ